MKFSANVEICVIILISVFGKTVGTAYGEDCSKKSGKTDSCNYIDNLRCNGKICECRPPTLYNKQLKRCIVQIGKDCQGDLSKRCTENATCRKSFKLFGEVTPPESILNMLSLFGQNEGDHKCTCNDELGPDKEHMNCLPIHKPGDACSDKKSECGPRVGMTCGVAKICACTNNLTMIFDSTFGRCVTRVGQKCDRTTQCEQNSLCTKVWEDELSRLEETPKPPSSQGLRSGSGQCECVPGYTQNSANRCVGSHRAACSVRSPCNKERFLVCVDGKCLCESERSEIFFEANGTIKCQLLPGSPCSTKKGPPCFQNSVCKNRKCECEEEYSKTPSGLCLMNYGGTCGIHDSCNYYQGLACVNSKCACFDSFLKWNAKLKMCAADEGGICGKFNPNQGVEYEAERANRTAPLFPAVSPMQAPPKYYYVGCPGGYACVKDNALGGNRCKQT